MELKKLPIAIILILFFSSLSADSTFYYSSIAGNAAPVGDFADAPVALAVGLRKLVGSYSGNAIKLRKSSDNVDHEGNPGDKGTDVENVVKTNDGDDGVKIISGALFFATLIETLPLPILSNWSLNVILEVIGLPASNVKTEPLTF